MNSDEARALMHEWTESASLRVHMESVAASMGAMAERLEPSELDRWVVCGLLHDFDYEKHPTEAEHPFVGVKHLESLGVECLTTPTDELGKAAGNIGCLTGVVGRRLAD